MSFRDDHDAALHRADAAERERRIAVAEAARLQDELAEARQWLGGARRSAILVAVLAVGAVALVLVGVLIGRATVAVPDVHAAPRRAPLPQIAGVIVGDGTRVGHWTLVATRCTPHGDGVQLATVSDGGIGIWLANDQVELETPGGTLFLDPKQCKAKLVAALRRSPNGTLAGEVELDCRFDDNRLQGRIDFAHCR